MGGTDAVLQFDRIKLIGKDVTIDAKRAIRLEAPAINLNSRIDGTDMDDLLLKGYKVRES